MSSPDVAEFLERLATRDESAARVAHRLLDSGWSVRELTGPVQMDVWQLLLERGKVNVRFGIERGRSDGMLVQDHGGAYRPILEAMSACGQANGPHAENQATVLRWLNGRAVDAGA